jgi:hypothetical protein
VAGRGRERGAARALERGTALLEEAAERSRPRTVAERLKANLRWFAQAALSTALAWALAQALFGHTRPIFAAMGALIGVSATPGQRRRSAVETVLGVALGIGIADALVVMIGDGRCSLPPSSRARWWPRWRWAAARCWSPRRRRERCWS